MFCCRWSLQRQTSRALSRQRLGIRTPSVAAIRSYARPTCSNSRKRSHRRSSGSKQDCNLGLRQTAIEQVAITGSGLGSRWLLQRSLVGTTMASCGAVVACAVVSLGIAVDAVLMGKIVEGALDYRHERQQLAASERQVGILQQRLDPQRALKQILHTQGSTQQWQDQRRLQLALQAKPTAPSPWDQVAPLNNPRKRPTRPRPARRTHCRYCDGRGRGSRAAPETDPLPIGRTARF
jgi:hypothetical protein